MLSDKELLSKQLIAELHRYGMRMSIFQRNMAQKIGVVHTDLKTANILHETGPITAGELSKITGLSTGSVTALIDRLEKEGYVRRERDESDRRRVIIIPVPDRQREFMSQYKSLGMKIQSLGNRYEKQELELILRFLQDITDLLDQENETLIKERDV